MRGVQWLLKLSESPLVNKSKINHFNSHKTKQVLLSKPVEGQGAWWQQSTSHDVKVQHASNMELRHYDWIFPQMNNKDKNWFKNKMCVCVCIHTCQAATKGPYTLGAISLRLYTTAVNVHRAKKRQLFFCSSYFGDGKANVDFWPIKMRLDGRWRQWSKLSNGPNFTGQISLGQISLGQIWASGRWCWTQHLLFHWLAFF